MKHRYELTDTIRLYVVTYREQGFSEPSVKAYTDDKDLLDAYMKFHGMEKQFTVKIMNGVYKDMIRIINDCRNDELDIMTVLTVPRPVLGQQRRKANKHDMVTVSLPLTLHDKALIDDGVNDFCSLLVDYGMLRENLRFVKDKYRDALDNIGLISVIEKVVMNQSSKFTNNIQLDELMVLLKVSPGDFA